VCMADAVTGPESTTPSVDTVSFYDDSEPNWNERPYFTQVERKRGRTGCHIAVGSQRVLALEATANRLAMTPASLRGSDDTNSELGAYMNSRGCRVVLSGIGGDEVTGGVPTPAPELEDLLARARFFTLLRQLRAWALNKRKPWFYLLLEVFRAFSPAVFGLPARTRPASWLDPAFVKRHLIALTGYQSRLKLFGPMPSFQENLSTLNSLRRQLGCAALSSEPLFEKRYPYLDRSLLEFVYAIPREQMVRPGQRRSLMRRALVGIVPHEVLERRRKAYVARGPAATISTERSSIVSITQQMLACSLGVVDAAKFRRVLQEAREGHDLSIVLLMRTFEIELWLRNLSQQGLLGGRPRSSMQAPVGQSERERNILSQEFS
jgi:asparagine synthase (glutamine-hydrolysing)